MEILLGLVMVVLIVGVPTVIAGPTGLFLGTILVLALWAKFLKADYAQEGEDSKPTNELMGRVR